MGRPLAAALAALALAACEANAVPRFERMSDEELAEYNRGRNVAQMIVCSDVQRSLSRVRRRRCMTVEAMYGSEAQARQLGVLNQVRGIGAAVGN